MCIKYDRTYTFIAIIALAILPLAYWNSNYMYMYMYVIRSLNGQQIFNESEQTTPPPPDEKTFEHLLQRMRDTRAIVYNRVPKTGSGTVKSLLKKLAPINHYTLIMDGGEEEIRHQAQQRSKPNATKPWIYVKHFYFTAFPALNGDSAPIYINTVRDPIERMRSQYAWDRRHKEVVRRRWSDTDTGNMSFDNCIAKYWIVAQKNCFTKDMRSFITHYFCGEDDICKEPSLEGLDRAKRNIERYYGVIADLTDFWTFFKVLSQTMPRVFRAIDELYYNKTYVKGSMTHVGKYSNAPSLATIKYLRADLQYEYELYYFIRQRYHALVKYLQLNGYDV